MERRPGGRSAARWLLIPLASVVLTAGLLELSLPFLHGRYAHFFRRTIDPSSVTLDAARRVMSAATFDAELGWDDHPIARDHVATRRYLAQSYGDSFVQGAGVGAQDTWQAHFERLTGQAIVNLGVGGYGLDQAVLKFEKYAPRYSTRIAILGLYHQMFRRTLSHHAFYSLVGAKDFTFAFKPIFVKAGDGFALIRPPCTTAPCLVEVLTHPDHEVWRRLTRHDYWYRVNEQKPVAGFPYTINAARTLPEIRRRWRERQGTENYFFVSPEALDVSKYLVERFAHESRALSMTPVCVLLYSVADLRLIKAGVRLDGELLRFLTAKSIATVDTSTYILDRRRGDDGLRDLSLPDGHLSGHGNLLVAEALAHGLASMALLE